MDRLLRRRAGDRALRRARLFEDLARAAERRGDAESAGFCLACADEHRREAWEHRKADA